MDRLKKIILNRLSEKSTYLGIASLLTALGISFSHELSEAAITAILALVGLLNVIMNESKKPEQK